MPDNLRDEVLEVIEAVLEAQLRAIRKLRQPRDMQRESPLDWLDVDAARKLPFQDPYDCLIAGTAIRLEVPLITRDKRLSSRD